MTDTSSILYRVGQKVAELTSGSSSGFTLPDGVIQVNASGNASNFYITVDDATGLTQDFPYYIYGPPNTIPLGDHYQVFYNGSNNDLFLSGSPGSEYQVTVDFSNQPLFLAPTFALAQQGYEASTASQSSSSSASASVSGELDNFLLGLSPDPYPSTPESEKFYTNVNPSSYTGGGYTNGYGTTARGYYKQDGDYMHINFSLSHPSGGLNLGFDQSYMSLQKISLLPWQADYSTGNPVMAYPVWQADQEDTWTSESQATYDSRIVKGPAYIGSAIARGQPPSPWDDGEIIYHLPVVLKRNFFLSFMDAAAFVEQTPNMPAGDVYSWDISYSYRLS